MNSTTGYVSEQSVAPEMRDKIICQSAWDVKNTERLCYTKRRWFSPSGFELERHHITDYLRRAAKKRYGITLSRNGVAEALTYLKHMFASPICQ